MAGKSLNKVQLIGNLGADPELRYTSSGVAVATLNIATNFRTKSPTSGEWEDKTEWHRVVAWDRNAEVAGEYLRKGGKVYVEGHLQTRSWDDKDGNKRYTTEIVLRDMILLSGRDDTSSHGHYPPHPADTYEATSVPTHTGTVSDNHAAPPVEAQAAPPSPPAAENTATPAENTAPPADDIPF